tara:strand:- start:32 stop:355 length:324 start_codon:yes stop_codon:yes gene_type:complete
MNITLDGKTFPVRASMRAWKNFEDETGCKVANIDSEDVTRVPELMYYFVKEGCKKQGMSFDMSMDDFLGLIEVQDLGELSRVVQASLSGETKKKPETEEAVSLNGTK